MRIVPFVLAAAWLAGAAVAQPAPSADSAAIRALRAQSNAAIARHDFDGVRASMLPDYTIFPGSSGSPFSVAALAERIGRDFTDPSFASYVRTTDRIAIADDRRRAAETGRWVGTWRKPDGTMRLSGIYLATWMPTPEGWRLKNESFVTLRCTGSRACAERR